MGQNEGTLFKQTFGGDPAHTEDHPPVILNGILAAGHEGVASGTVLISHEDGITPYSGTGTIIGVCDIPADNDSVTVSYVAHGTVKAGRLKNADGSPFTNYSVLALIGIYAV